MIDLGHRRVGFIAAPLYYNFAYQRLQGYKKALLESGIDYDETLVAITEMNDDAGETAGADLLDSEHPPTAFVCTSDTQAFGVLAAIRARGLKAGADVSVMGYDGLNTGRHTDPPLTTMSQPLAQAGRELADMLLAIIDGDDPANHQTLKRADLLLRKSDGPLRAPHYH